MFLTGVSSCRERHVVRDELAHHSIGDIRGQRPGVLAYSMAKQMPCKGIATGIKTPRVNTAVRLKLLAIPKDLSEPRGRSRLNISMLQPIRQHGLPIVFVNGQAVRHRCHVQLVFPDRQQQCIGRNLACEATRSSSLQWR